METSDPRSDSSAGELKRSFRNIAKSSTVTKDDQATYIKEKPNEILLEREPVKLVKETTVLSFGDGSHGALGHVDCFGGDAYEPGTVEGLPSDIVSVGTGHYHSLAVTKSGELWAWGRNSEGQLGSRDTDSRYVPLECKYSHVLFSLALQKCGRNSAPKLL